MHINKQVVVLTLRCQHCGAQFGKEVDTFSFGLEDTLVYHSKRTFIHACNDNSAGIAEVRGGRYKVEHD